MGKEVRSRFKLEKSFFRKNLSTGHSCGFELDRKASELFIENFRLSGMAVAPSAQTLEIRVRFPFYIKKLKSVRLKGLTLRWNSMT